MKIGYIRAEKKDDVLYKEQKSMLQECERLFEDCGDGVSGLEHMLDYIRTDDKIHVYQLDRFGLNIRDVIMLIHDLIGKGIHIMSMHDNIDTSTHEGRVLLKIFNVLHMCEQNSVLPTATSTMSPITTSIPNLHEVSMPKSSFGQLMSASTATGNSHGNLSVVKEGQKELLRNAGRPKGLTPQAKEKAETAAAMYQNGSLSMRDIAQNLDISTATLYSYLRHEKVI